MQGCERSRGPTYGEGVEREPIKGSPSGVQSRAPGGRSEGLRFTKVERGLTPRCQKVENKGASTYILMRFRNCHR